MYVFRFSASASHCGLNNLQTFETEFGEVFWSHNPGKTDQIVQFGLDGPRRVLKNPLEKTVEIQRESSRGVQSFAPFVTGRTSPLNDLTVGGLIVSLKNRSTIPEHPSESNIQPTSMVEYD